MAKTRFVIIALIAALAVSVFFNFRTSKMRETASDDAVNDTVRITVTDTVKYFKPVPRDSVVLRYDTARLPVLHDTVTIADRDTIVITSTDSVDVVIPISQKIYADSTYTAYVSGYHSSLDSIFVYPTKETLIITKTPKPKRWSIGVNAGYGITPQGFQPYVGIGISYGIFNF